MIELHPAARPVIEELFQLYLHDMSSFGGWSIGDNGRFAYPPDLLPPYWQNQDHAPFVITSNNELAGFALLRPSPPEPDRTDMGQFFVLRKFAGQGVGRAAFQSALAQRPGKWLVRCLPDNKTAFGFWRKVISQETAGNYTASQELNGTTMMHFFRFETS
ncbi:MAG: GNAT family N-acetyltransferase [Rhodobacteraceae bacterium]|nr:GNAT family N-acetyltransferase [Paracoccaceae bacterium]